MRRRGKADAAESRHGAVACGFLHAGRAAGLAHDVPAAHETGRLLGPGEDPLARALHGEEVTNQVFSVRPAHARWRWGLASAIALTDERKRKIGAATFVLDITERMEEQERVDELRDRLIETVNHEVGTPLATICGHVEVMEEQGLDALPDWAQWSVGAISRGARRLTEVAAEIADLADRSQRGPRRRH